MGKVGFGRQDINEILQAFTDKWGIEPVPKQQQRRYCKLLIDIFKDKTMDIVTYAISIQDDEFAPRITSPKDLYYKHLKVMDYYQRNQGERVRKI